MPKKPKMQTVKVPDYDDEEINRLAVAQYAIEHMEPEQRLRALKWFKARFSKEWPSDTYD